MNSLLQKNEKCDCDFSPTTNYSVDVDIENTIMHKHIKIDDFNEFSIYYIMAIKRPILFKTKYYNYTSFYLYNYSDKLIKPPQV